jgi:polyhydroxyalkanoate synthesis regulator phasin
MVEFMRAHEIAEEEIHSQFSERIAAELVGARCSSIRDVHDLSDTMAALSSNVEKEFKDLHTAVANLPTKQEVEDLRKQIADLPTKQDYENLGTKVEDLRKQVADLPTKQDYENLGTKVEDLRKQVADLPTKQDIQEAVSKCISEIFRRELDRLPPADGYVLPSYPQLLYYRSRKHISRI